MRRKPDREIARLAASQHNTFSRAQALSVGMTQEAIGHRISTGRWDVLEPGIYCVAGTCRSNEQLIMSAILAVGDGAMASFYTAAWLFVLIESLPRRIHVTIAHGRHHASFSHRITHQVRHLSAADCKIVRGIPATRPERTLVDLAGVLRKSALESALDTALMLGLCSVRSVERYIETRNLGWLRGVGKLRALISDRAKGVPESELERRFIRLIDRMGLPEPVRQKRAGNRRIDFAYPDLGIMIELDGWTYHRTPHQLRADNRRQNELVLKGWTPLRLTWHDIRVDSSAVRMLASLHRSRLSGENQEPPGPPKLSNKP